MPVHPRARIDPLVGVSGVSFPIGIMTVVRKNSIRFAFNPSCWPAPSKISGLLREDALLTIRKALAGGREHTTRWE